MGTSASGYGLYTQNNHPWMPCCILASSLTLGSCPTFSLWLLGTMCFQKLSHCSLAFLPQRMPGWQDSTLVGWEHLARGRSWLSLASRPSTQSTIDCTRPAPINFLHAQDYSYILVPGALETWKTGPCFSEKGTGTMLLLLLL